MTYDVSVGTNVIQEFKIKLALAIHNADSHHQNSLLFPMDGGLSSCVVNTYLLGLGKFNVWPAGANEELF